MDLKFQLQLQQEFFEVQQELPQTKFLCPAQKVLCQVVGVEVVVVVVVEEEEHHQHLLLTSLAVLDVLVLYHKDRHQFRKSEKHKPLLKVNKTNGSLTSSLQP